MSDNQSAVSGSVGEPSSQSPSTGGENEAPSPMCLLRVRQELARMKAEPIEGVYISPDHNDVSVINALIIGPADTPYDGGFFHFTVKCMRDYPTQPPRVRLITPGSDQVQFNARINDTGLVHRSILGTPRGPTWNLSYTISTILRSIQSALDKDCGIENSRRMYAVSRHRYYVQHETVRVAVCDVVEDCLNDNCSYPAAFKDLVLTKFLEFYSKYEELVNNRQSLNGYEMKSYLGAAMGSYQYERLLTRLQELQAQVKGKVDKVNDSPE